MSHLLEPGARISPQVDEHECLALFSTNYAHAAQRGRVTIRQLNGYDDKNYLITVASEQQQRQHEQYVLKILNRIDSRDTDFVIGQCAMLVHLGARGIACPQPVRNTAGELFSVERLRSGDAHVVRLLSYVDGDILHRCCADINDMATLCQQIGAYVAHIDNLLQDFTHPSFDTRETIWMLRSAPQLRAFLFAVADERRRAMFAAVIDRFEARVTPLCASLPTGIIHGDVNEQNLLVRTGAASTRFGILDFGDAQRGCYVFEVAIAMTYMMLVSGHVHVGGDVLRGYIKTRPLDRIELEVLPICILARLTQSLVLGAYSAHKEPENVAYILTTAVPGWNLFEALYAQDDGALLQSWLPPN